MSKVRLTGIKVDVHKNQDKILRKQIITILHIKPEELVAYELVKRSLDARKKDKVVFIYTLDVQVKGSAQNCGALQKSQRDLSRSGGLSCTAMRRRTFELSAGGGGRRAGWLVCRSALGRKRLPADSFGAGPGCG